jgi:hypothetical protein
MRSSSIWSRPAVSKRIASGAGGGCGGVRPAPRSPGHVLRLAVGVEAELLLRRGSRAGRWPPAGGRRRRRANGPVAALLEQPAELGGRGRLSRAVQAHHHDLERPGRAERGRALAEEADELVVDDLDDLLAGRDALQDLLAGALGLDALHELAGDLEVDVGREEGGAGRSPVCRSGIRTWEAHRMEEPAPGRNPGNRFWDG